MEYKQQIIIIIDDAEYSQNMAKTIAGIIETFPEKGYDVSIAAAEKFSATDLLPAKIFFVGCETPKPASFSYIDELMEHINFAGRSCGVFSSDDKAIEYLAAMISNTGASVAVMPAKEEKTEAKLKAWIQSVIERNKL